MTKQILNDKYVLFSTYGISMKLQICISISSTNPPLSFGITVRELTLKACPNCTLGVSQIHRNHDAGGNFSLSDFSELHKFS
jgi:hypothetical protein